jgi:uroporphyrinogen III methyltransferase / synthase
MTQAQVFLVGAGPGDPGLITLRGMELLRRADVVIYDRPVDPTLLREARPDAEMIYVGKSTSHHTLPQFAINSLLVARAAQGKVVVRLKCGDPYVFGHGGEEALALAAANIPFEVVPGVSAAIAVPASAGIPVTHEGAACIVTLVGEHADAQRADSHLDWAVLAGCKGTLVFMLGLLNLPMIVKELVENGRALDTPAAVIERGTASPPRVVVGTLADIHELAHAAHLRPPAVIVVGDVVALREKIGHPPAPPRL